MTVLVMLWGFDYVVAKTGLEVFKPMSLLFCKYSIGFVTILTIKLLRGNFNLIRPKDIPVFLLCSLCGEVLYFNCEYNALSYIPASLVTIVLAFVPLVSIIVERVIFKRKANKKIIAGMILCILGVVLVIGTDFSELLQGKVIGSLLVLLRMMGGAVIIAAGYIVIKEKAKLDSLEQTAVQPEQIEQLSE